MSIKILFSDLDGTLVSHGGDVTEETLAATKKLQENGIELVIVTGRHADTARSIHNNIGLTTPVIGCNGGMIKDFIKNEIIYCNEISKDKIKKSVEIANQLGVGWMIYEQNSLIFEKKPPLSYKVYYDNEKLPEKLRANFIQVNSIDEVFNKDYVFIKVLLLFDNNIHLIEEGKRLLSEIEDVVILRSANEYLDVMPLGSSKGNSVKNYLELIGIDSENVASIGDAENDLDMIKYAGFGIAMGNGIDKLKNAANHVTSSFPSGFNDAVEHIIKLESGK